MDLFRQWIDVELNGTLLVCNPCYISIFSLFSVGNNMILRRAIHHFILLILVTFSLQASAHHSTAIYDSDNPIELKGRVVEWQFTNPHTFIILAVEDNNGEEVIWSLEGGNTSLVFRRGWTPESLQPGDELIVTVRPLHSGAPGGNYSDVRNADGTPFDPRAKR